MYNGYNYCIGLIEKNFSYKNVVGIFVYFKIF